MSKPRQIETRTTTLDVSEARVVEAPNGNGTVLVGYPVVFDTETTIREGGREFRESFTRGSLKQTLLGDGKNAVVMFDHGTHPWVGSLPLGRPSVMRTDDHGLYVEVPLSDTSYNRDLAVLIRDQCLTGMSVRMQVIHDAWENPRGELPIRRVKEIRLLEFGPVVFPAYPSTSVGMRERLSPERAAALAKLKAFAERPPIPGKATPM